MNSKQVKWLVTNGDLGTFDNRIVYYTLHNNGRRALQKFIQEHADRTGKQSWAEIFSYEPAKNRYYPRNPNN